jgi:hypothetical protein
MAMIKNWIFVTNLTASFVRYGKCTCLFNRPDMSHMLLTVNLVRYNIGVRTTNIYYHVTKFKMNAENEHYSVIPYSILSNPKT